MRARGRTTKIYVQLPHQSLDEKKAFVTTGISESMCNASFDLLVVHLFYFCQDFCITGALIKDLKKKREKKHEIVKSGG